jgi:hypothetical protein
VAATKRYKILSDYHPYQFGAENNLSPMTEADNFSETLVPDHYLLMKAENASETLDF